MSSLSPTRKGDEALTLETLDPRPETPLLRGLWIPVFGNAFTLSVLLAVVAGTLRGVGMLGPQRLFWILPVGFILMALTPYLFFRPEGRRRAGLRLPRRPLWII